MLRLFVLVLWKIWIFWFCLSIAQSCSTLHDPMDCSKPGFCPSLSPGVCSNSCPLSWWCHPTYLPLLPLSPCALSLSQHQGLFQCLASSGQSIGTSTSASVLPKNIQGWFPLRLTGLVLLSESLSRVFSTIQFENISSLVLSVLYGPTLTSVHATGKTIALIRWTFVSKVMSLHFNTLSGFS